MTTPMTATPGSYLTPPPMANGMTPPAVGGRPGAGGVSAAGALRFGSVGPTPQDQVLP